MKLTNKMAILIISVMVLFIVSVSYYFYNYLDFSNKLKNVQVITVSEKPYKNSIRV